MWHSEGYVVMSNLVDDVFDEAHRAMSTFFPPEHKGTPDFGGVSFPSCTALDKITLHPNILSFARRCLGDIMLTQSEAWCKGELGENADQRMHMDFGNHCFTKPAPWPTPEVIACIVYFDDTRETGGATALVPYQPDLYPPDAWTRMPGINYPFANNRYEAEKLMGVHKAFRQRLYDAEIKIQAKPGDVLFYRHDLWHRGTPVKPGKTRRVMNIAFKKTEAHHIYTWCQGFARKNYYGHVEAVIRELNDSQRSALGIPMGRCRL